MPRANRPAPETAVETSFRKAGREVERHSAELKKELRLGDLVLTQILFIVGLGWIGTAAKLGPQHFMFWLGAVDPARIRAHKEKGAALPGLHSSEFAPLPEPTVRTGVKAMTSVVLDLLKK